MVSIYNKRKERDMMKLMMSNYEVTVLDEKNKFDFSVTFKGPKESAYEGVIFIFNIREFGKCMFYYLINTLISHPQ
jgi:ubiquitin-protein ligase